MHKILYDYASKHMEENGDANGARIYLDAALPRQRHWRSPGDYLEWVDNVVNILHDDEMAADGIREAEKCARGGLGGCWSMWDSIAKAWLRVGKKDEAHRALTEGPPRSSLEEMVGNATLWMEAFSERKKPVSVFLSPGAN